MFNADANKAVTSLLTGLLPGAVLAGLVTDETVIL